MNNRRLEGKVAVITGAAGGIGAASARLFASEGATLIITDLNEEALNALQAELRAGCFEVLAMSGNLTDSTFIENLFNAGAQRYGKIDVLYNNAGSMRAGSLNETTITDFNEAFALNLIAQTVAIKHAAPLMKQAGNGSIVNTASMGGLLGFSGMLAYTASKAAIIGATKSLAMELSEYSIRVNAIAPGIVETQMPRKLLAACPEDERDKAAQAFYGRQLLKRFADPTEIAKAALFLCSDDASFITGVILPVDGGWSCW